MESKNIMSDKQGSTQFSWRFSDIPALVPIKKRRMQIIEVSRSPSPPSNQLSPVLENSPPSKYVLDSPSLKARVDLLPSSTISTLNTVDTNTSPNSHCSTVLSPSPSAPSSRNMSIQSLKFTPSTLQEDSNRNYSSLEDSERKILRSEVKLQIISSPETISPASGKWSSPEGEGSSPTLQSQSVKILEQNASPLEGVPIPVMCGSNSRMQLQDIPTPNLLTLETQFPDGKVGMESPPKPKSPLRNISSPNALSSTIEVSSNPTVTLPIMASPTIIRRSSSCLTVHEELPSNTDKSSLHCSEGSLIPGDETRCDNNSQEVEDGELVISREINMGNLKVTEKSPEVTSRRQKMDISKVKPNVNVFHDDRSCWDLNREMDSWDKTTDNTEEKKTVDICVIVKDKLVENPEEICDPGFEQDFKDYDCGKDRSGVVGVATTLVDHNEHVIAEDTGVDANDGLFGDDGASSTGLKELHHKTFCEAEMDSFPETKDSRMKTHEKHMLRGHEGSPRSRDGSMNELPEDLEVEEQMDYSGVSLSGDDADDGKNGISLDSREPVQYERYQETGSLVSWGSKTISGSSDGQDKHEENLESQRSCISGRIRATGWDQLPEGFDNAEEALKAMREALAARRGGKTSTTRSQGISGHRFAPGRDLSRDSSTIPRSENYRERHFEDRREHFVPTKRMNDNDEDCNWDSRVSGREAAEHSSRGRGSNEYGNAQGRSTGQWGQGRSGFSSNRPSHTSSSRPDSGLAIRDNVAARGGSGGGVRSAIASSRAAGECHHTADVDSGSKFSNRLDRETGNSGMEPRGRGHIDRYTKSYGGFEFNRSTSPHKLHSSSNRSGSRGLRQESKSFPVRNQWSPAPPKWSSERREGDSGFREREFKGRSYGPSGRTSPHVVHGSSLMDERDWQVLAGTLASPTKRERFSNLKEDFYPSRQDLKSLREEFNSPYSMKSGDDGLEGVRRVKFSETEGYINSKDDDYERSPRDGDKYRDTIRGYAYQRERDNEAIRRRRDSHRVSGRDISTSVQRHASSLEGDDDDMAPRRRRPS